MNNHAKAVDKKPIETIALENNVVLKLFDDSKKAAPDHWQVTLTARIEIPLSALYHENHEKLPLEHELREALGDPIFYEYKSVRNFIADRDKITTLKMLHETFNQRTLSYLSKPAFHKNHAIALYKEHVKRKTWYPSA
jgi:hypothetical protein